MMVSKPMAVCSPPTAQHRFYAKLPKLSSGPSEGFHRRVRREFLLVLHLSASTEIASEWPSELDFYVLSFLCDLSALCGSRFLSRAKTATGGSHAVRHHHQARHAGGAHRRTHAPGGS